MIITVIRKPFKGSLVENTKLNQCGAININQSRISTTDSLARPFNEANNDVYGKYQKFGNPVQPSGRWPANLILSHLGACECVGTRKVKGKVTTRINKKNGWFGIIKGFPNSLTYADKDGLETIGDWCCAEGCPVPILDTQSGVLKAGVAGSKSRAWGAGGDVVLSSTEEGVGWKAYGSEGYADEGGAARFFKVVKE